MPYYRHKIIANSTTYKPLKCQEFDASQSPKFSFYHDGKLDFTFQVNEVEKQYQLSTISERKWNVQLASVLYAILSTALLTYFILEYILVSKEPQCLYLIYTCGAALAANIVLVVLSYTIAYHSLLITSLFMTLIGFIPSFTMLYFGRSSLDLVHLVFVWSCPIFISTILLHMPLVIPVLAGVVYSGSLVAVAYFTHDMARQSYLYLWTLIVLFGVVLIAAAVRFYDEITSRRVYQKIGKSLISRQQALEETLLKEVMIKSIMPEGVCVDILHSGMLHDVVLCKDPENMMRNLPIKLMEPVSILFADLVGFTAMSSTLEAADLVSLLTDLYGRFDCVAEAYSCENIAILGDCYVAVSGCPEPDERHADNCMYTGVGLINSTREFCQQRNKTIDIRVGIHTGIVLCGIVGGTKFKYDVWSSDAKTANYMESGGVPGRVHISEQTKGFLLESWELEEGFGAKREPELQGIRTWLLKKECQDAVVVQPKKKQISDTVIFRTIEKKRGSGLSSKDFDGSVSLQSVISNEDLAAYTLLPILHPTISSPRTDEEARGNSYKCMTSAPNGTAALNGNHEEGITWSERHCQALLRAARRPWNLYRAFTHTYKSDTEKLAINNSINPITASLRSSKLYRDFLNHGWSEMSCMCVFSRGFTFLSTLSLFVISLLALLISLLSLPRTPVVIVTLVCNVLIFTLLLVTLARWRRVRHFAFLESLNCLPFLLLPTTLSVLLLASALVAPGVEWMSEDKRYTTVQIVLLPVLLGLSHFLLHERQHWVTQAMLLVLTFGGLIAYTAFSGSFDYGEDVPYSVHFGYIAAAALFITIVALLWLKSVKTSLRFATLHECSSELAITKEEEKVTTQLFNAIIPKHVSDSFLTELKYSHSYDHVGVIFASITNFWDFYEEKFQGGMGCIRVLNEIVRDIDDLLSTVDNSLRKSDPRWRAIQKIKTVGACYMAASGLDPVTEEQTKQGNHEHIIHLMEFSFKILDTIKQFNSDTFGTNFTMKIGFNYGPVTDGIIGQNKVLYDIWGDTVNLSSRMMSTGVVGRIQLPAAVVPHLIDHFKCPKRGKVTIKGKGEMITHFCTDKKTPEQIKSNLESRAAKKINSFDA